MYHCLLCSNLSYCFLLLFLSTCVLASCCASPSVCLIHFLHPLPPKLSLLCRYLILLSTSLLLRTTFLLFHQARRSDLCEKELPRWELIKWTQLCLGLCLHLYLHLWVSICNMLVLPSACLCIWNTKAHGFSLASATHRRQSHSQTCVGVRYIGGEGARQVKGRIKNENISFSSLVIKYDLLWLFFFS